jgi:hypothetical protein
METVVAGIVLGVVLVGSGVVVERIARRASSGTLLRNGLAGVRTKATMASDEAWLEAHQRAEGPTRIGGIACAVAGLVDLAMVALLLVGAIDEQLADAMVLIATGAGTVGLMGFGLYGCVVANRAAKEVSSTRAQPEVVRP